MSPTSKKIIELSNKWYKYVNLSHHKDRDCHWIIEIDYAYGDAPVFTANHYGYIADILDDKPARTTLEKAEGDLLELLEQAISNEKEWAGLVLANKKNYDNVQIKLAEKCLELFKEV